MRRIAYFQGRWYPDAPAECRRHIDAYARQAPSPPALGPLRGVVAPHAGWPLSGHVAARAFRVLAEQLAAADLVVLFGAHRSPRGPNTLFRGDAWETPLGDFATPTELTEQIGAALPLQTEPATPWQPDNAPEVLLPFAKHYFADAELLMLGVAASEEAKHIGAKVGQICRANDRRPVFVASTDLTHYGPAYRFAPQGEGPHAVRWVRETNDRGFIAEILDQDASGVLAHALTHRSACCPGAVAAAMCAAESFQGTLHPWEVAHSLSYDVHPADSFVGYSGVVF